MTINSVQLIQDGAVVYNSGAAVPPPVVSPPGTGTGTGLYMATSAADMVAYCQAQMDGGRIAMLDPRNNWTTAVPLTLSINYGGGTPFGIMANGAGLTWGGGLNGAVDLLTITSKVANRCLVLEKLSLFGNGYSGAQCRNGLVINAPKDLPIYKATLRDLYTSYFNAAGLTLAGDFYESLVDNPQSENNFGDGMVIEDLPASLNGVISNVMMRSVNLSRNIGYGLRLPDQSNSVDITQGSFVLNGLGGIVANNGIRSVSYVNFENTGLIGIDIPSSAYMSTLVANNASTEGITHAPGGQPMKYLYRYHGTAANLQQQLNYITYYGVGTFTGATRAP